MTATPALSVLDISPVPSGVTPGEALANTVDLARLAEALGFARYWLAEHHNTPALASSVPEVMIARVAAATSSLRIGSGGIMLPNHSPLKVVETFRVLETLHPGRIDLGLGRAPGTDTLTALALRRSRTALAANDFPEQLAELLAFFSQGFPADHPFAGISAIPEGAPVPPIYLLGSSDFSADAAAQLGLGFAFAHHINPGPAVQVLKAYRDAFEPSEYFSAPHAILAVSAISADTDEEAEELASGVDVAWLHIGRGRGIQLPSVAEARAYPYTPAEDAQRRANRARHNVGSAARVATRLRGLADASCADEIMVMTIVHDHGARRRSYELLADALRLPAGCSGRDGTGSSGPSSA